MGKYDKVMGDLPPMPPDVEYHSDGGEKYQAKIDEMKRIFTRRSPEALAVHYVDLRAKIDEENEVLKKLKLQLHTVEQLMEKAFEDSGLRTLELKNVGTIRHQPEPSAVITDRAKLRAWLEKDPDYAFQLSQMVLASQTINSITKERLLAGEDEPPGVELYIKSHKFVLTKARS